MPNVKTNYEYHVPSDLNEALELMARYGSDCKVIAGGTDLIPKVKAGILKFGHLISLKDVDELKVLDFEKGKGLTIGAAVDLYTTEKLPEVKEYYPALYTGIHSMANTQIRNRGTVTGNICNAVPSADTAPALLVYDAVLTVKSAKGEREVPIGEFFTGVCRTVLEPDELVTKIFIPVPPEGAVSVYYKYTIRKALELAMIGAASNVACDSEGKVTLARIALGAVAVVPKRAFKAEEAISGQVLDDELIEKAARIASEEDCAPISDIRASADYRRRMVYVHVRDALRKVVEES